MAIYHPPSFINAYLSAKLGEEFGIAVPFFPTSPTALSDATETQTDGVGAVYDRMLKMRRSPFPHIKSEQLLYYFYGTGSDRIAKIVETTQIIQDLLDREDESAQEVNRWLSQNDILDNNGNRLLRPYFHRIKIYQLEETRDIVDFGTARTFAGNKIIIDYDWHKSE